MSRSHHDIYRANCRPLRVIPTGERPILTDLPGIAAVLFDVYGTMFISGSGDIGAAQESGEASALAAAFAASGYQGHLEAECGIECMLATILAHHESLRARGFEYPEVNIVDVWSECLDEMKQRGWMDPAGSSIDVRQLAIEYEVRANPTWPMPGLLECLAQLRAAGLTLGIISNAQFFTLEMFPGLLGQTVDDLGFVPELQYYSFRHHRAKPDMFLYELASKALAKRGILAEKVIYVGNDMLNDVQAARSVGFRTALFAGDRRSLRWRTGDPRVQGVQPDVVLTDLESLGKCISSTIPSPAD
ncbi:MAG: HAD family hydrolase [Pirellulaceae bacterium]|nr:HAD family hydrolase [Pirellulaceae bacterium]